MRAEFKRLHRELGTTTLYATPDQLEALSIGERVAVIQHGRITQVDTPERLYARPVDRHVAALIGDPPINLVKGTLKPGGNAGPTIELPFMELDGNHWREGLQALDAGTELLVGIRPHDLTLVDDGGDGVAATIEITEPQGDITILDLKAEGVALAHGGGGSDRSPLHRRRPGTNCARRRRHETFPERLWHHGGVGCGAPAGAACRHDRRQVRRGSRVEQKGRRA